MVDVYDRVPVCDVPLSVMLKLNEEKFASDWSNLQVAFSSVVTDTVTVTIELPEFEVLIAVTNGAPLSLAWITAECANPVILYLLPFNSHPY